MACPIDPEIGMAIIIRACTGRCLPSYIRKSEKKYGICCICGRIAFAFYIYDSAGAYFLFVKLFMRQ